MPRPADLPDTEEDADTLEGNARLKAVAVVEATGELAVADDTGLEVDALDGRPGVYAARYGRPDGSEHPAAVSLGRDFGDRNPINPRRRD